MIIPFKKKPFPRSPTYLLDHLLISFLVFLALAIASYLFFDELLALACMDLPLSAKAPFLIIGRLFCPIAWVLVTPVIFFYIRFLLRKEKKARFVWFLSLTLPLTVFFCKILQIGVGRATPEWFFHNQDMPLRFFDWNVAKSFPSLTSVTIAVVATCFSCIFSKARLYILIAGLIISMFPALIAQCFLSDALAGFFFGSVLSMWIFQKMSKEVSL